MKVFVIQAEHPYIPGKTLGVYATSGLANVKAAQLATVIRDDILARYSLADEIPSPTPDTWDATIEACQDVVGAGYCWIDVTECEVTQS